MTVLPRGDAPRGEAFAGTHPVNIVDDRNFGIAGQQEISVQRMRGPDFDGPHSRHQCLADDLPAEHPLPAALRRAAAEQVHFQRFEIENVEKILNGGGHAQNPDRSKSAPTCYAAARFTRNVMATPAHAPQAEVVIGGAGFAGLALAIALRQGLGNPFAVTVIDPALAHAQSKDPRASAIAAAARRLFEAIDVWDAVAADAQPILDMVVTDSTLDDAVRPTFLTFGGDVEEGEPFAHMVENRHLVDALATKARDLGVDLRAGAVAGFENAGNVVDVSLADGEVISAGLLVGAD